MIERRSAGPHVALVSGAHQAERGGDRAAEPRAPGLRGVFSAALAVAAASGALARSHRAALSRLPVSWTRRGPPAACASALDDGRRLRRPVRLELRHRPGRGDPELAVPRPPGDRIASPRAASIAPAGFARPDPCGPIRRARGRSSSASAAPIAPSCCSPCSASLSASACRRRASSRVTRPRARSWMPATKRTTS